MSSASWFTLPIQYACSESAADGGGDGDGSDREQAACVAEFATDRGRAHGLADPLGRASDGERGEGQWGDHASARADEHRGELPAKWGTKAGGAEACRDEQQAQDDAEVAG